MNQAVIDQLVHNGPTVSMLAIAIVYFYRRDVRNETRNERREGEMKAECDKEQAALVTRIQELEDRMHRTSEDTLWKVAEVLSVNTRTLARFCDSHASGYHPAVEREKKP